MSLYPEFGPLKFRRFLRWTPPLVEVVTQMPLPTPWAGEFVDTYLELPQLGVAFLVDSVRIPTATERAIHG